MKFELYLTATPYHILLSSGLALNNNKSKKILIIRPDFSNYDLIMSSFKIWKNCPFDDVILLNGNYSPKYQTLNSSFLRYTLSSIDNLNKIKKIPFFKNNRDMMDIYVFNDDFPEYQYLCYKNKNGKNIYVEDGSAAYQYIENIENIRAHLKYILDKIIFGRYYYRIGWLLGTSPYIDECLVFYPNLVNKSLKNKKLKKISNEIFSNLNEYGYIDVLSDVYNISIPNVDSLIVLERFEYLKENSLLEDYLKIINTIIANDLKNNKNILIKYHPREVNNYLNLKNENIHHINQSIPMEVVYLVLKNRGVSCVYGTTSTSLITSKIILPDVEVISLMDVLNIKREGLKPVFESIGIKVPKDLNELITKIK